MVIMRQEVLGMSTGRRPAGDKVTQCWIEEVKDAIRAKKKAKKKCETSGRQDDRDIYKQTKKLQDQIAGNGRGVLKELQTLKGEHNIYRIGKARDKSTKDFMEWFYAGLWSSTGSCTCTCT